MDANISNQTMSPDIENFLRFASALPDIFFLVSRDGVILAGNEAARQFINVPSELAGKPLSEISTTPADKVREYLRYCAGSGQMFIGTMILKAAGRDEDCRVEGAVLRAREDKEKTAILLRAVPKALSTSTFVALNEKIEELSSEIKRRIKVEEDLVGLAKHLERSNEELEQYAYIASHDLQEPMRMVSTYLDLLEEVLTDKLTSEEGRYLSFARDGAVRAQQLIRDLLQYARIGKKEKNLKLTDMNEVFDRMAENADLSIAEGRAEVTRGRLPALFVESSEMLQLFQNLVGNALKYRRPDTPVKVHVSAEETSEEWIFTVQDNGIGIAKEHQEKIFKLFQRLHPKEKYSGTGIGLTICNKIVSRYSGRLWVESEAGKGSAFSFSIPKKYGSATAG